MPTVKTKPYARTLPFRHLNCADGFTLLEILVALSILSIVLIAVYRMHSQTINMNMESRFYSTATLLAQRKMAEIKTNETDQLTSDSGNFGNEHPGYDWQTQITDVESEALGETAQNLKKIDLTVKFNQADLSYHLTAYQTFWE